MTRLIETYDDYAYRAPKVRKVGTERRGITVDAVYDIETEDWTSFVMGGVLWADGAYQHFDTDAEEKMVLTLLSSGACLWAHSGGTFDHKWLLDHAGRLGCKAQIVAAGSRIVMARLGRTKLFDSAALFPVSLQNLTEGQGVTKEKLGLKCICDTPGCEGYCAIRRKMGKRARARCAAYLEADCRSLFEGLTKLQAFAQGNNLDLGATIGSSAWKNAQRELGLPNAELDANEHTYVRRGYYGGRVQLVKPGYTDFAFELDVNSMYPWALKATPLPTGERKRVYGADAWEAFKKGKAGIYTATVDVPSSLHLPPLPYRTGYRLAYPTGFFLGTWALPELEWAQECGVRVADVSEAMVWKRKELLFGPWVDRLFAIRSSVGKKTPMGTFLKLYLNSLTGKLGSNPDRESFFLNPDPIKRCEATSECRGDGVRDCRKCCRVHCNRKCGAMIEHSDRIFSSYSYGLDACAHVEWAAYLTAAARVALNRQQLAGGADGLDVLYCDTDSIFSLLPRHDNTGDELGEWQDQGEVQGFYGFAPKSYHFRRAGELKVKAKGISAPRGKELIAGYRYGARGVSGLKKGAKVGVLFTKKLDGRILEERTGDRILLDNGMTRAPSIEELKKPVARKSAERERTSPTISQRSTSPVPGGSNLS